MFVCLQLVAYASVCAVLLNLGSAVDDADFEQLKDLVQVSADCRSQVELW